MANGLRPLYCPWPRCFAYHTIVFGAAFTLPLAQWGSVESALPFPLLGSIKAHTLCEGITHLG